MKFEKKIIPIETRKSTKYFLTLQPREKDDLACRAITSDIRNNVFAFLGKNKNDERPYIFFEGELLYIIVSKVNNRVYFIDKYYMYDTEINNKINIFFVEIKKIVDLYYKIMILNLGTVMKENYKGTGLLEEIKTELITIMEADYKTLRLEPEYDTEIYNLLDTTLNNISLFLKNIEYKILYGEEINLYNSIIQEKLKIKNSYVTLMEYSINILLEYLKINDTKDDKQNIFIQSEYWDEWEEALLDWEYEYKKFMLKEPYKSNNKKKYLNEFLRLIESKSLYFLPNEPNLEYIKDNTISYLIEKISDTYGVKYNTVIRDLRINTDSNSKEILFKKLSEYMYKK